ncbi:ABC transporter ATP-binding protein [Candidatus Sumerlaeota bacterium]|nr:ABC transporter ATP-binding protein [Candidatus Sumerlaeota bacterium]
MRLVMEGKGEALAPGADRAAIKGAIETAFMKHPAGHGFSRQEKGEKKEKGSSSLTNLLPEGVRNWFGNTKTGPLHYFNEKSEEIRQWYGRSAHESPRRTLFMLSGLLTALTLIKCLAEYLSNYHTAYAFYFINMKMREDIYRNILAQDYAYFVKNSPGFLISRISSDVGAIKDIIDKILTDGIQEPLNLMAYTLALFYLSPRLTLIVFLITPPLGILIYFFNNTLRKNTKRQKKKADELAGSMSESLFNIRLVKAFGTEEVEIKKYIYRATVLFKYIMNRRLAKFGSGPIMEFLGVLMASGVLVLGGMMILGDGTVFAVKMKPSDFFLFLMLLTRFYRPIKSLSATTIRYQIARVSSERIQEMLSLAPKVVDRADSKPFEGLREGIEFRNVCFRYKNKEILRNVSFLIPKGKIVAVVGKSGAGKTTLANLVPRLYDPSEGAVLLDGVDLRDYRATDIRRRLGIVTQQTILFDDTVANNIAYGADDAHLAKEDRMAKIIEAAKAAYADEFIQQLDGRKGYNTRLGISGTKLSGGQSQRIAIARALYRNPEILILDEATSALDSNAQAQVQAAIDNVIHDRTAIIIAHRFSTIRHADNIIVLRDGELIEQGTHDELMTRQGHYYELYMKDLHRGEGGAEETSAPQEQEGPLPEGEKSDRDQRKKKKRRPEEFVENF